MKIPTAMSAAAHCLTVQWQGVSAQTNVPSVTGIDTPCAWSVETQPIQARSSVTATASVLLPLAAGDPTARLQEWLRSAGEATDAATSDSQVTSTAYPAQNRW